MYDRQPQSFKFCLHFDDFDANDKFHSNSDLTNEFYNKLKFIDCAI